MDIKADKSAVEIEWQQLEHETLLRLLGEIVTRDGTDYGEREHATTEKIDAALASLAAGSARLYWNTETETAVLLDESRLQAWQQVENRIADAIGIGDNGDSEDQAD